MEMGGSGEDWEEKGRMYRKRLLDRGRGRGGASVVHVSKGLGGWCGWCCWMLVRRTPVMGLIGIFAPSLGGFNGLELCFFAAAGRAVVMELEVASQDVREEAGADVAEG